MHGTLAAEFDLEVVVSDGRAMLEAAQTLRPDVIVADVTMPHLNGIDALIRLRQDGNPVCSLTPRQREVLQLLAEGRSAKEIASSLAISARTVEFHEYQMMETLGIPPTPSSSTSPSRTASPSSDRSPVRYAGVSASTRAQGLGLAALVDFFRPAP